jgi:hypothetical protein
MTDEQIEKGWRDTFSTSNPFCPCDLRSFTKVVKWAERALLSASKPAAQQEPVAYLSTDPKQWGGSRIKPQGTFTIPVYLHPAAPAKSVEEAYAEREKAPDYCPYNKRGFGAGYRAASPQAKSTLPAQTERALTELVKKWERWQADGERRGCPSTNGMSTAISDVRALLTAAQLATGGDSD